MLGLQGCIHGDLNLCYKRVEQYHRNADAASRLDYLVWTGDVQTCRNDEDLEALACPRKYRSLKDFPLYYQGFKTAPVLTLFIGGNHEASSFLHSLYFGGWVAPNIYFLGKSAVVNIGVTRIAALSGIFKGFDYAKGYFEKSPYDESTSRSVYHVRKYEVRKLHQVLGPVQIMVSHDWPTEIISDDAERRRLISMKPFFKDDLASGRLGNPASNGLLRVIKPNYWIAAHLHVNFKTIYSHSDYDSTTFIAHDKPKKTVPMSIYNPESKEMNFLDEKVSEKSINPLLDSPAISATDSPIVKRRRNEDEKKSFHISVDLEWLCILKQSFSEFPLSDSKIAHTGPNTAVLDWKMCLDLASRVGLRLADKDLREEVAAGGRANLYKFTFRLPDWDTLFFRDPNGQTRWWIDLLGLDYTAAIDYLIG